MRAVVLLGRRIGYSFSPPMHNAAFAALELPYHYVPLSSEAEDLPRVVEAARRLNFLGGNVTWPFKEEIIPFLDDLSDAARECGSVNVFVNEEGKLIGHSTDGLGFRLACRFHGIRLPGRNMLLIGAGGAGRAVAFAAVGERVSRLVLVNRTVSRAKALCEELRSRYPGLQTEALGQGEFTPAVAREADIIVNATSVGMGSDDPALVPPVAFRPGQVAYDLVYAPPVTPFLSAAEAAGAMARNGLSMLLFQGEESFRFWTHKDPPHAVMAGALATAAGLDRDYFLSEMSPSPGRSADS